MTTYIEGRPTPDIEGKIVIVVAKFNHSVTDRLLEGALSVFKKAGIDDSDIIVCRVPGAFEIPIVAKRVAELDDTLAVVCLGAVIKGETSHDQHINRAVSGELMKIGCATGVPVIFGVLTCDTAEQAVARSGKIDALKDKVMKSHTGNKGADAAEAALEMIHLLAQIPDAGPDVDDVVGMLSQAFLRGMAGHNPPDLFDSPFDFDDDDDEDGEDDDEDDYEEEYLFYDDFQRKSRAPAPRRKKTAKKAAKKSAKHGKPIKKKKTGKKSH